MWGVGHGFVGHGYVGVLVAGELKMRGLCSWVSALGLPRFACFGLLRFACFGCASGAGVFGLGFGFRMKGTLCDTVVGNSREPSGES